jgi:hypothetical protein
MADPKTDANEEENKKKKEQEELNNAVLGGAAARSAAAGKMANPKDEEKPDEPGPKAPDPQDSSKKSLGAKVVEGLKKVLSSEGGTIYINIGGSGKKQEPDQKPAQPKAPEASSPKEDIKPSTGDVVTPEKPSSKLQDVPKMTAEDPYNNIKPVTLEAKKTVTEPEKPSSKLQDAPKMTAEDPYNNIKPVTLEAKKTVTEPEKPSSKLQDVPKMTVEDPYNNIKPVTLEAKKTVTEPAPLVKAPPEIKLPADNNAKLLEAADSVANAVKQMGKSIEPKAEAPRIKLGSPKSPTGSTGNIITAVKGLTEQLKGLTEAISKPEAPKAPDQGRQKMQDVAKLEVDDVNDQVLLKANKQAKDGETPNPSSPRPGGPGR